MVARVYRSSRVSESFVLNSCQVDYPTDSFRAPRFLPFFCEFVQILQIVSRGGPWEFLVALGIVPRCELSAAIKKLGRKGSPP